MQSLGFLFFAFLSFFWVPCSVKADVTININFKDMLPGSRPSPIPSLLFVGSPLIRGEIVRISDPIKLVSPGQSVVLGVNLVNNGTTAWPKGYLVLEAVNKQDWRNTELKYDGEVAPGETVLFEGTITSPIRIGVFNLTYRAFADGKEWGPTYHFTLEVSCSNGIFCDGVERFVQGKCVNATYAQCDDFIECTEDVCNETTKRCFHTAIGENCASCYPVDKRQVKSLTPGKKQAEPSTCDNPSQLPFPSQQSLQPGFGDIFIDFTDSNEGGYDQVSPACNPSKVPERVYYFDVPDGLIVGLDARMEGFDSVLDLRKDTCWGESVACSDDATPPGIPGSRVQIRLCAGHYILIADAYSAANVGNFTLQIHFKENCVPLCSGQFCGSDGCGGDCGPCSTSDICTPSFRCQSSTCQPNCTRADSTQFECGEDGCGGSCGSCNQTGAVCNRESFTCVVEELCNGLLPVCGECGLDEYCDSTCTCRPINDPLPDLVLSVNSLLESGGYKFDWQKFTETNCALVEGCILEPGIRRLLRFTVQVVNQGLKDFIPPFPASHPNIYTFSSCHNHYHFNSYANYVLLNADQTEIVILGHKQGYCVADSNNNIDGNFSSPLVPCEPVYSTCNSLGTKQGMSVGWTDFYGGDLDCQWLDITGISPGNYTLYIELNFKRTVLESTYENNRAYIPIEILAEEPPNDQKCYNPF